MQLSRLIAFAMISAALAACASPGMPADISAGRGPDSADYSGMLAQFTADAARPGDEQMSCDALQAEFHAIVEDPTFKATMAQRSANAMDRYNQMRGQAPGGTAEENRAKVAEAGQLNMQMMPQTMRLNRIFELGRGKDCAFAKQPPNG